MDSLDYWRQAGWGVEFLGLFPFLLLLFLIAVLPFLPATASWWEKSGNKLGVCAACALAGSLLCLVPTGDISRVARVFLDYLDFMAVMTALYVVGGGIHIAGTYEGFPFVNTLFLLVGALLSNLLGTTGASMLLVRPLLAANRHRKHKTHILVFFIFIVSNCGACLIPLGPPLYLGYLQGVPFLWTLHLLPACALTVAVLLVLFYFYDGRVFEKEEVETKGRMSLQIALAHRRLYIRGGVNLVILGLILGVMIFSGYFLSPLLSRIGGAGQTVEKMVQIAVLSLLAWVSFRLTPRSIHRENRFKLVPLGEVAILFFGIFGAMIPPLSLMEAKASSITLTQPWQYFWASGLLSAFLDNAPTYLNFSVLAAVRNSIPPGHLGVLASQFPRLLAAVSCGASFMGALTYIGNGPNLMVKAIAEHHHVRMPSFGGYLLWSGCILIPVFILVTFVFF
jgi:Na+/H+ antiporter NhaD/arsenite permease-like protein